MRQVIIYVSIILIAGLLPLSCSQPTEMGESKEGDIRIGVMPKLVGIGFFNAAQRGAEEAGREIDGVSVDYNGPVKSDVTLQAQMVDTWIARGYDAIAIAPNDPKAIADVLRKARNRGLKVITWDADAEPDSRDFFVNQSPPDAIARSLMDIMVEAIGPEGKYLIVTGSLTAANQNIWMDEMEKYRQERYPNLVNLSPSPIAPGEDQARATEMTMDCLRSYSELDGIFAITSVALPGAAEALRKTGKADEVFVTGLATPNDMREYVKDGTIEKFVLWSPVDLGYLAVHAAAALVRGELHPGDTEIQAGHLGTLQIEGDEIILGDPLVFTIKNIDDYDF